MCLLRLNWRSVLFCLQFIFTLKPNSPGAYLIFSRGGGGIFPKLFESSPDELLKRQSKKGVFRHLFDSFAQKNCVFSAGSPLQNLNILRPPLKLSKCIKNTHTIELAFQLPHV